MARLNRREFIKIAGAGAAVAAVGSALTTRWFGLDSDPVHDPGTEGDRIVPTLCELCFWKCGVLAHVKGGVVTKLTGNPEHPLSRGRLCPRGAGGTGLLYDPDRLKKPLLRVAARGGQEFREVEWAEALDYTADRLRDIRSRYGAEALALFQHGHGANWFKQLLKAYGSSSIAAPSYAQCRGPREAGFTATFGTGCGSPENLDLANSRCITLIGSHLGENMHNTQVQEFAEALARGAGLVVVDPRFSVAAGKADFWLPIKPGTDLALLLAWVHVVLKEGLFDREYVARHAVGLDELKAHVADKTPQWAWTVTGLPADRIVESARFLAGARPASLVHPGRRVTWYGDDTQRSRAIAILNALLGSWGRRGGFYYPAGIEVPPFPAPETHGGTRPPADTPRGMAYPLADEVLASGLCDATIPGTAEYDIHGWLVYGTNLVKSLPNPPRVIQAIQALDFIATVDVLPVEICGWSDVVLPEATYLERCDDVHAPQYKVPYLAIRQPVVEPMYDSKPGWWIAKELANRLGLAEYFLWTDGIQQATWRVHKAGYDCDTLKATGVVVAPAQPTVEEEGLDLTFPTPSGKIELYSRQLKEMGADPVPVYTPVEEPPEGMFRLLFGRAPTHSFGRTINNRLLAEAFPENELWVSDAVCRELGLKVGDRVMVVNQAAVSAGPIRVRATRRIRRDCVYMVHGWGTKEQGLRYANGRGASDSDLVSRYKVDPLMGGTGMNVNFVRMEKV
jgi:thiosulfate reductase/polysulfide reductase chain A